MRERESTFVTDERVRHISSVLLPMGVSVCVERCEMKNGYPLISQARMKLTRKVFFWYFTQSFSFLFHLLRCWCNLYFPLLCLTSEYRFIYYLYLSCAHTYANNSFLTRSISLPRSAPDGCAIYINFFICSCHYKREAQQKASERKEKMFQIAPIESIRCLCVCTVFVCTRWKWKMWKSCQGEGDIFGVDMEVAQLEKRLSSNFSSFRIVCCQSSRKVFIFPPNHRTLSRLNWIAVRRFSSLNHKYTQSTQYAYINNSREKITCV